MKSSGCLLILALVACQTIMVDQNKDEDRQDQQLYSNLVVDRNGIPIPPMFRPAPPSNTTDPYGDSTLVEASDPGEDGGLGYEQPDGEDPSEDEAQLPLPPLTPPPAGNSPPTFTEAPDKPLAMYYDSSVRIPILVEEPDGEPVTVAITRGKRPSMELDDARVFTFTPDSTLADRTIKVDVTATDGFHQTVLTLTFEVLNPYEGMLNLGSYSIDPYEAVVSYDPYCAKNTFYGQDIDDYLIGFPDLIGYQEHNEGSEWGDRLFACTVKGEIPSRYITWPQAKRACENMGKRLCSFSEFKTACADTPKDKCNWDKGAPYASGGAPECAATTGTFDMIGNLREWTTELRCEPVTENDPCHEQCLFLHDQAWCDDAAKLNTLRTEKPLGIGFHQVGGFFGNNGEWYAECGKVESGLAEEGREGVGFRCCK
ncbi:MAG: hypothetical protein A2284_10700 [Deltaproteobacteria bacterium RIFOXYA12_FULL_61_11]|nr:MAG: hypothetical protein A2284_10700 [Deltaproteobacteria bacterium RIFOXYA12_FULL_61_11]